MVDLEEFKEGLESLEIFKKYSLTDGQIEELYKMIDSDNNGVIDYDEFLHSFEIIDTADGK